MRLTPLRRAASKTLWVPMMLAWRMRSKLSSTPIAPRWTMAPAASARRSIAAASARSASRIVSPAKAGPKSRISELSTPPLRRASAGRSQPPRVPAAPVRRTGLGSAIGSPSGLRRRRHGLRRGAVEPVDQPLTGGARRRHRALATGREAMPLQEEAGEREAGDDIGQAGATRRPREKSRQRQQPVAPALSGGARHRAAGLRRDEGEVLGRAADRAARQIEAEAEIGQQIALPAGMGLPPDGDRRRAAQQL